MAPSGSAPSNVIPAYRGKLPKGRCAQAASLMASAFATGPRWPRRHFDNNLPRPRGPSIKR